jgi:hypothetical protein
MSQKFEDESYIKLAMNDDYKIIYRVEPYSPAGSLLSIFECDDSFFKNVDGWYPSEMTDRDEQLLLKSWWTVSHAESYPEYIANTTTASYGNLWFKKKTFARICGRPQVVQPLFILLNAPKASMERPLTSPAMFENVMVSAVTCKAVDHKGARFWVKSEVASMVQRFTLGPVLTVRISLYDQPGHLVNFRVNNSSSSALGDQLSLSEPLIKTVRSAISRQLNISDRQVGALKRIDAVDISIQEPSQTL